VSSSLAVIDKASLLCRLQKAVEAAEAWKPPLPFPLDNWLGTPLLLNWGWAMRSRSTCKSLTRPFASATCSASAAALRLATLRYMHPLNFSVGFRIPIALQLFSPSPDNCLFPFLPFHRLISHSTTVTGYVASTGPFFSTTSITTDRPLPCYTLQLFLCSAAPCPEILLAQPPGRCIWFDCWTRRDTNSPIDVPGRS
jgi:hypothetical protein